MYYAITHNRNTRQLKTDHRLYPEEWDMRHTEVNLKSAPKERKEHLLSLKKKLKKESQLWAFLIRQFDLKQQDYQPEELISSFSTAKEKSLLFYFMQQTIERIRLLGRESSAENYEATFRSFQKFRQGKDLLLLEIDSELMVEYEAWLKKGGTSPNTSSFYMRNLRSIYNQAVEKMLTPQKFPFKKVYTGIGKTLKRAIDLDTIREIREMEFSAGNSLDYARDLFLFSFYTRGMSFVDMAYLKRSDLQNGVLSYRRRKTGQLLTIKWEKCMQDIIDKHEIQGSEYLLPIIKPTEPDRKQYRNASHWINYKLKEIGRRLSLPIQLTLYVARHSWASIAKSKQIPVSVISECMGHESEYTTQIYLASLDTATIDNANRIVIQSVCKDA